MLRKFSNYLAVIALSLMVTGNTVLADSASLKKDAKVKTIAVDGSKEFHYYTEFLQSGGKHTYNIKVEAGKEVKVVLRSPKGVSMNIRKHNGEVKNYSAEKYFEVRLRTPGEYVLEVESLSISQYAMEVFNR